MISLTELEVSRRVVETPLTSISRETRNKLLAAQGVYLQHLYAALARQIGRGCRAGRLSAGGGCGKIAWAGAAPPGTASLHTAMAFRVLLLLLVWSLVQEAAAQSARLI